MSSSGSPRSQPLTSPESSLRNRKRQHPPVLNGIPSTYEERNSDFLCPICFDIIEEAHMTQCGHTFCFKCITMSLEQSNRCPRCNHVIEKKEQIFPNFLLNELITKHQQELLEKKRKLDSAKVRGVSEIQEFFMQEAGKLELADVNYMLEVLQQKKQQLEADCKAAQILLLKEFLQQVREHKQQQMAELTKELNIIDEDLEKVEEMIQNHKNEYQGATNSLLDPQASSSPNSWQPTAGEISSSASPSNSTSTSPPVGSTQCNKQDGFNGSKYGGKQLWMFSSLAARRKRMHVHFEDLKQCYFTSRAKEFTSSASDSARDGLEDFTESLSKFTRYNGMRTLATLSYSHDLFTGSTGSIVSSIEFDKDNEFFAIAGVTKKIKVFEYGTVIQDAVDIHYPINEMECNSKISCISWSSYHKGMLASSDYEGTVTLWDAFTGEKTQVFQEHEKRCWSVDFNRVDTKLVASGSDDTKVKLWSAGMEHSITSLDAKANVCCVKFNPASRYHLAFGSADHCVHYYDLRNLNQPLAVFTGHKKAVSYVKFLNPEEIVSASTDSQLKLWNVNKSHYLRSFRGHFNEKNFVGLATDGDYVACGSENNALYIYYKGLCKQVLMFRFDTVQTVLEKERKEDMNEFVSAVCWRTGSNVVVAANSQGTIKVLELV